MESSLSKRNKIRKTRIKRVRKKLKGTAKKPRLAVYKTNKHISAQLIDDESGVTLFGIGTGSKSLKEEKLSNKSKDAAAHIGKLIGNAAKEKKIESAIFDRGRFKFHGLIAELAKAAREAGLKF